jgi:competence protein ComEC
VFDRSCKDDAYGMGRVSMHPRPAVPFLLICAMLQWGGMLIGERIAWTMMSASSSKLGVLICVLMPLIGLLIFTAYGLRRHHRVRSASVAIGGLFLLAGMLCVLCPASTWTRDMVQEQGDGSGMGLFDVCEDARPTRFGHSAVVRSVETGRCYLAYWDRETSPPPAGARVRADARQRRTVHDEQGRRLFRKGLSGSIDMHDCVQEGWSRSPRGLTAPMRERVRAILARDDGSGSILLEGIVLGSRMRLGGSVLEEDVRICGLAHLIAVSGSHLAVVNALALWLLDALRLSRRMRIPVITTLLVFFLLLSGVQTGAVRACIMTVVGMSSMLVGRRRDPRAALGAAACAMLAHDRSCAFSLSFALSVLAVLGISIISPLLMDWFLFALPRRLRGLAQPFSLTLAAQLTCLPITAPVFHSFSPISPFANLLIAPCIDLLLGFGLLLLPTLLVPASASLLYSGLIHVSDLVCKCIMFLAQVPFASFPTMLTQAACTIITVTVLVALWAIWPRPSRRRLMTVVAASLACILLVILPFLLPVSPRLVMMDVGQGDALLLSAGRHHVLIDAGEDPSVLEQALMRQHVRRLDAVMVTHLHTDHYGGLEGIGRSVHIGSLYLPAPILAACGDKEGFQQVAEAAGPEGVGGLSVGDRLLLGPFAFEVLSPAHVEDGGGNQDSLCLRVSFDGDGDGTEDASAFLCGDAEVQTTGHLARKGLVGHVDVLKVGHHGSEVSLDDGLLDTLSPRVALISVGAGNGYGHPDAATLDLLSAHGVPTLRTDLYGDIRVLFGEDGISVECQR